MKFFLDWEILIMIIQLEKFVRFGGKFGRGNSSETLRDKKWGGEKGTCNDDSVQRNFSKREKKVERSIEASEVSNNRKSFERKLLRSSSFEIKNIYNTRDTKFLRRFDSFQQNWTNIRSKTYLKSLLNFPFLFIIPVHERIKRSSRIT